VLGKRGKRVVVGREYGKILVVDLTDGSRRTIRHRGWSEEGMPTDATLKKLGV
jgi:aldehyde:ferredoxin oxidoreductase